MAYPIKNTQLYYRRSLADDDNATRTYIPTDNLPKNTILSADYTGNPLYDLEPETTLLVEFASDVPVPSFCDIYWRRDPTDEMAPLAIIPSQTYLSSTASSDILITGTAILQPTVVGTTIYMASLIRGLLVNPVTLAGEYRLDFFRYDNGVRVLYDPLYLKVIDRTSATDIAQFFTGPLPTGRLGTYEDQVGTSYFLPGAPIPDRTRDQYIYWDLYIPNPHISYEIVIDGVMGGKSATWPDNSFKRRMTTGEYNRGAAPLLHTRIGSVTLYVRWMVGTVEIGRTNFNNVTVRSPLHTDVSYTGIKLLSASTAVWGEIPSVFPPNTVACWDSLPGISQGAIRLTTSGGGAQYISGRWWYTNGLSITLYKVVGGVETVVSFNDPNTAQVIYEQGSLTPDLLGVYTEFSFDTTAAGEYIYEVTDYAALDTNGQPAVVRTPIHVVVTPAVDAQYLPQLFAADNVRPYVGGIASAYYTPVSDLLSYRASSDTGSLVPSSPHVYSFSPTQVNTLVTLETYAGSHKVATTTLTIVATPQCSLTSPPPFALILTTTSFKAGVTQALPSTLTSEHNGMSVAVAVFDSTGVMLSLSQFFAIQYYTKYGNTGTPQLRIGGTAFALYGIPDRDTQAMVPFLNLPTAAGNYKIQLYLRCGTTTTTTPAKSAMVDITVTESYLAAAATLTLPNLTITGSVEFIPVNTGLGIQMTLGKLQVRGTITTTGMPPPPPPPGSGTPNQYGYGGTVGINTYDEYGNLILDSTQNVWSLIKTQEIPAGMRTVVPIPPGLRNTEIRVRMIRHGASPFVNAEGALGKASLSIISSVFNIIASGKELFDLWQDYYHFLALRGQYNPEDNAAYEEYDSRLTKAENDAVSNHVSTFHNPLLTYERTLMDTYYALEVPETDDLFNIPHNRAVLTQMSLLTKILQVGGGEVYYGIEAPQGSPYSERQYDFDSDDDYDAYLLENARVGLQQVYDSKVDFQRWLAANPTYFAGNQAGYDATVQSLAEDELHASALLKHTAGLNKARKAAADNIIKKTEALYKLTIATFNGASAALTLAIGQVLLDAFTSRESLTSYYKIPVIDKTVREEVLYSNPSGGPKKAISSIAFAIEYALDLVPPPALGGIRFLERQEPQEDANLLYEMVYSAIHDSVYVAGTPSSILYAAADTVHQLEVTLLTYVEPTNETTDRWPVFNMVYLLIYAARDARQYCMGLVTTAPTGVRESVYRAEVASAELQRTLASTEARTLRTERKTTYDTDTYSAVLATLDEVEAYSLDLAQSAYYVGTAAADTAKQNAYTAAYEYDASSQEYTDAMYNADAAYTAAMALATSSFTAATSAIATTKATNRALADADRVAELAAIDTRYDADLASAQAVYDARVARAAAKRDAPDEPASQQIFTTAEIEAVGNAMYDEYRLRSDAYYAAETMTLDDIKAYAAYGEAVASAALTYCDGVINNMIIDIRKKIASSMKAQVATIDSAFPDEGAGTGVPQVHIVRPPSYSVTATSVVFDSNGTVPVYAELYAK